MCRTVHFTMILRLNQQYEICETIYVNSISDVRRAVPAWANFAKSAWKQIR